MNQPDKKNNTELLEGLNGGTSITLNTSFFGFVTWNSSILGILTLTVKNTETVNFFKERSKNGSKKANIIFFSISRSFQPFYDNSGLSQKISEGYRRFPKTVEEFRRLTKRSDHCWRCPKNPPNIKHLFTSETVNIKKLANLTANTKHYGQITLNTKLHSDPPATHKHCNKKVLNMTLQTEESPS